MSVRLLRSLHAAWLVLAAVCFLRPVDYVDVWWHLASGEAIWRDRAIASTDMFSWTNRGRSLLNAEWLYDWILFGLHAAAGTAGIVALKAVLCLGILYTVWRRLRLFSDFWLWPASLTAVIYAAGFDLWHDRSELISVFLLSCLALALDSAGRSRRLPRALWLWPALFCFWANVHGMFSVGLLVCVLWSAAEIWQTPSRRAAVGAWLALCVLGSLLNVHGLRLHRSILAWSLAFGDAPIYELQATLFHRPVFWACAALLWLSFAARRGLGRTIPLGPVFICAAFTVLGMRHLRGVPLFAVIAFPYVLDNLSASPILEAASSWARRRQIGLAGGLLAVTLAALAVQAGSVGLGVDVLRSFSAAEACDFIVREGVRGPFYNDYPLGSYLIWRFKGAPGSFVDGRWGSIEGSKELFARLLAAQKSPRDWNAFLEGFAVSAALVRYPWPSASLEPPIFRAYFPRDRWALVYWDDLCLLFLRRNAANASIIGRTEFGSLDPDTTMPYFLEALRRAPQTLPAVRRELARNLALHPSSRRARELAAALQD